MNNEWITISQIVGLTKKSEITIRRFATEHKNNKKAVKKERGKYYINSDFIKQYYPFINDNFNTDQKTNQQDEVKHKKEAMQLVYNSEALKSANEQLKAKDEYIRELIHKKSHAWLYVTIGFIILIVLIIGTGWLYRSELLSNHKTKISDIAASNQKETNSLQKEITNLTSSHQKEVNLLKNQLSDTKKSYSDLIKEIKETNNKLSVHQQRTIKSKEAEISILQTKLDTINRQTSSDTEK